MANVSGINSQCGMSIIHNLGIASTEGLNYQIDVLRIQVFGHGKPKQAMAILTDRVEGEDKRWVETKSVAFKSEARINPNSLQEVRIYIIYPEHLALLEEMQSNIVDSTKKVIKNVANKLTAPLILIGRRIRALVNTPSGGIVKVMEEGVIMRQGLDGTYHVNFPSQLDYWVNYNEITNGRLYEILPE